MKRVLLLGIGAMIGIVSMAAPEDRVEVVKITSGICGRQEITFQGSGVVFRREGRDYVLTSEHVLLHANEPYCHKVWNRTLGALPAKLVAADWGYGLALLALDSSPEAQVPGLEAFPRQLALRRNDALVTAGFPWALQEPIIDEHGYVLIPRSERHLFPAIRYTTEIYGAHGEFGMSGGPIYLADGKTIAGLLSHQYVQLVPGGESHVAEYEKDLTVVQNQLIMIPSDAIRSWLDTVLDRPASYVPTFALDPELQIFRQAVVYVDGVRAEAVGVEKSVTGTGFDGVGGAGGAEGIGGQVAEKDSVVVQFTPEGGVHPTRFFLPGRADWMGSIRVKAEVHSNRVEIPFFVKRGEGTLLKVRFGSLAEFFCLLNRSELEPVVLLHPILPGEAEDQTEVQLRAMGQKLEEASSKLIEAFGPHSVPARLLLVKMQLIGQLLHTTWAAVTVPDLKQIQKREDDGWKYLFAHAFDQSVALYDAVNEAERLLARLKM